MRTGDGLALARYPDGSRRSTASTSRWRGTFVTLIGNPAVMRELTRVGMHSRTLMEWVLRIMANLLRPDELGPAEAAYTAVELLVAVSRILRSSGAGNGLPIVTRSSASRPGPERGVDGVPAR